MATYYLDRRHDFALTDPSTSDVIGFICAQENNQPVYYEFDGDYLAPRVFTDEADESHMNPEVEWHASQSDWRKGFGQYIYNPDDPKRYFRAIGMDFRYGYGVCSPALTAATLPTHTVDNWSNPINWSDPGSDFSNENYAMNGSDANYATGTLQGGTNWTDYLYFYVPSVSCSSVRMKWGESGSNYVAGVEIDVYYNDAWTNVYTQTANPAPGTITQALAATYTVQAARVRFQDNAGSGGNAYVYYVQFYAESATVQGIILEGVDFNDNHYFAKGNTLLKLAASDGAISIIEAFNVDITDLEPFQVSGTDYLMIALGTGNAYYYMSTAEACTESTATDKYFKYFKYVHTDADTLYGAVEDDKSNSLRSTVNPLNGGTAWSAQTIVGEASLAIQGLHEKSGALYIPKEDMWYYLDSSGNVQSLAPELKSLTSSTSNKNATIWQNKIYTQAGVQALLEIGTANTWLTPASFTTNSPHFNGNINAVTSDDSWLYAILQSTIASYSAPNHTYYLELMAGRWETIEDSAEWVWHPAQQLTYTTTSATVVKCQTAWVSSIYKKRLYIAPDDADEGLHYMDLYDGVGDITSDDNRNFQTGGVAETPWFHGNFKSTNKAGIDLTLTMGHTYNAGRYITAAYQKLEDSSWTNIGNFTGSATSMVESKFLAAAGTSRTSTMFRLKFTAVTDDSDYTPILLNYDLKGIMMPPLRKLIYTKVRVGKNVVGSDGMTDSDKVTLQKTCLDNIRSATWFVTLTDIDGSTKYVKFLPLPQGTSTPRRKVVLREKGRPVEWEYSLLMEVVNLS